MNCEIKALSAIFLVHWTKKYTYKIAHLSGLCQIIKIHQFPQYASVIIWHWWDEIISLSFSLPHKAKRYRSVAIIILGFQSFEKHCLCHFI